MSHSYTKLRPSILISFKPFQSHWCHSSTIHYLRLTNIYFLLLNERLYYVKVFFLWMYLLMFVLRCILLFEPIAIKKKHRLSFIELYLNDLTNKNEKQKKKRKVSHILIETSKWRGTRNNFTGLFSVYFDLFFVLCITHGRQMYNVHTLVHQF